ncbi:MAG: HipA domain-containing protein [Defluviitaleaceae bacterium]|nr:HipA domain-containing protein [Defluviitaleaceae bacterium]
MIDFNKSIEVPSTFGGSEKKMAVEYENNVYMLKFPDPIRQKKNVLSYMNNQYSESIGCRIFQSCGFDTQETALGIYIDEKGKTKTVVGCKDFTQNGSTLHEFSKIGNAIVSSDAKFKTHIEDVHLIIDHSKLITDKEQIRDRFWDMFVVDALIGNADRHLDNWGLLRKNNKLQFAPIYDCGSSLSATKHDGRMEELMANPTELKNEEYNTTSCYHMDGKKIRYHEIFKNPPKELQEAIKRTVPKIDMDKIHAIIDDTPEMSDVRKKYMKTAVSLRYDQILLPAYKK